MKAVIVGLEKIDYKKTDGTEVDSVRIHVERKDPNVVGTCVEPIYISTKALSNLGIAIPEDKYEDYLEAVVEIEYNNRGFIAGFAILPS